MRGMHAQAKQILARQDGFTVVELVIVSALMVVVLVAAYNIFSSGLGQFNIVTQENQAVRDAGHNIQIMSKYLRETEGLDGPLGTGDPGDYGVSTRVDLDNNGDYETVTFSLDQASKELRTTFQYPNGSSATIVYGRDVQNGAQAKPVFTYYDSSGQEITNVASRASRATSIQIRMVIDHDSEKPPSAVDVSTSVSLRNSQI